MHADRIRPLDSPDTLVAMQIHEDITGLLFLRGRWRGTGRGIYPTIEPFDYTEEVTYVPGPGKPFLIYTQRTWRAESDQPLHSEAGYLRGFGDDTAELVIAQPTGIVEIHTGSVTGTTLHFDGEAHTTPAARSVSRTRRNLTVDGDELHYSLDMEAVGQRLQHHLSATLRRVAD